MLSLTRNGSNMEVRSQFLILITL